MRSLYLETKTSKLQPSFTPNNMCYILAFKRIISLTVSSKETTILFEPKGVGEILCLIISDKMVIPYCHTQLIFKSILS